MNTYTPRPGSKTEAAIEYLRANGGAATAIDLAEAIDTECKNMQAIFLAAIGGGLIEACDLTAGVGYRLCGTDAAGTARPAPARKPKAPAAAKVQPAAAVSAADLRRIAKVEPYLGAMPVTPAKPAKAKKPAKAAPTPQPPPSLPLEEGGVSPSPLQGEGRGGDGAATSQSQTSHATFRVGEYSDGSIRIEGIDPALVLTHNAGEGPHAVTLSPAAARILVEFLHPVMDVPS